MDTRLYDYGFSKACWERDVDPRMLRKMAQAITNAPAATNAPAVVPAATNAPQPGMLQRLFAGLMGNKPKAVAPAPSIAQQGKGIPEDFRAGRTDLGRSRQRIARIENMDIGGSDQAEP